MDDREVIAYVRVSTGKQAEEGMSLEAQQAKLEHLAASKDIHIAEMIVDAESAKNLDREGMARLLEMVKAGRVKTVLIAKLDRLTRSIRDFCELMNLFNKHDVTVISNAETLDTGSAAGRMLINVLVVFSEFERESTGERTREVLRHLKAQGRRTGTVKYGYSAGPDKMLVECAEEQAILGVIRRYRENDGMSLREIASELNAQGMRTRRGTPWVHQYVSNVLNGG